MASKTALERFFETKKADKRLLGHVERHILSLPAGDRRTDVLHPSEIVKKSWCKRASYFLLRGAKKAHTAPALRLHNIFEEGHYIHAKWQGYFQQMGVLHGKFECDACGKINWGTSPDICEICQHRSLTYAEVTLEDPKLRIAGHTDGWVKGIGDDCLIEIKSIGAGTLRFENPSLLQESDGDLTKAWKNIRRPFPSHLLQGNMYLELAKRMGLTREDGKPIDEIVFIYELKADQDYKEFAVKADFDMVEHVFRGAESVIKSVETSVEPDCTMRPGSTCVQCEPYKSDE
jgi:hypothetical protein